MDFFSAVSVVSISTFKFSEFRVPSVVAIVNFSGRAFSHFGFRLLGVMESELRRELGVLQVFSHLRETFRNQIYLLILRNSY